MPEEGNMARHAVRIGFDPRKRQIICMPHRVIAKKRDSVQWECVTGQPFTVDFGWDSPFVPISFPARAREKRGASIPVRALEGRYEYFVALYDAKSGLVYTLDPEMIVRG